MPRPITDTSFLRLAPPEREMADKFLAAVKGFASYEVTAALNRLQHGVNYTRCGKVHCASAWAEAQCGLSTLGHNALRRITLEQIVEKMTKARQRSAEVRARKEAHDIERRAKWAEDSKRAADRKLAADRWQALERAGFTNMHELIELADAQIAKEAA